MALGFFGVGGCAAGSTGRPVDGRMFAAEDRPSPRAVETSGRPVAHICWIDTVEVGGTGVRVRLTASAPVAPGQSVVPLEPGASFSPATSGHDGCGITALRRGGALGVLAESHFFDWATMAKPQTRSEWIVATTRP